MTGGGESAGGDPVMAEPLAAQGADREAGAEHRDLDLLRSIAEGDRAALAALYHRFSARLLGAARRTLASQEDAEDIVHDVFLEVWRRAADYDASRGSVAAWLLVRTRSRSLDRLKSPGRRRRASIEEEPSSDKAPGAARAQLASETPDLTIELDGAQVWRALGELPPDQRAVVELAYFEGLTLVEVGACLGVPAGTVKSRLSRAIAAMRALFA